MNTFDLDWALWRSFLAILRENSLSGAARALDVAHPTIRRHLDELEARLGSPLFMRSPSGLVATDMALSLREAAETMESAASLLLRTASADGGAVAGAVRIAASEVMGVEVLPPILSALKQRHPGLSFELVPSNSIEDILRHDADIAVRMTRPTQNGLLARKVGNVRIGLYVHDSWMARHGEPVSLPDLIASGGLIGLDRNPSFIQAFGALGFKVTPADFGFRSESHLALLAALRAGLGVGICQQALAAREPKLKHVFPAFAHALEIWLVTHPSLKGIPRVRATMDALVEGLIRYIETAPQTRCSSRSS
jgi:DNA-binding transcriptional LysR family regulator